MRTSKNAKVQHAPVTTEMLLERDLDHVRYGLARQPKRAPSYSFKVGETVRWGAHKGVVVLAVLDDSHIYLVSTEDGRKSYLAWHSLYPTNENNREVLSLAKRDIVFSTTSLGCILQMYHSEGFDFDAPYQRGLVWTEQQKTDLISSIFHGCAIGSFILNQREMTDRQLYEVIDGKQRLSTIIDFVESRFSYKGIFFKDLSRVDQLRLLGRSVEYERFIEISEAEKLEVFLRFNVCGTPQDPEHLKKVQSMLEQIVSTN